MSIEKTLNKKHKTRYQNCTGQIMTLLSNADKLIEPTAYVYWNPLVNVWFVEKDLQIIRKQEYKAMIRSGYLVKVTNYNVIEHKQYSENVLNSTGNILRAFIPTRGRRVNQLQMNVHTKKITFDKGFHDGNQIPLMLTELIQVDYIDIENWFAIFNTTTNTWSYRKYSNHTTTDISTMYSDNLIYYRIISTDALHNLREVKDKVGKISSDLLFACVEYHNENL